MILGDNMNYKLDRNYTQEELDFIVLKYKSKTDEELLKLIRDITKELGQIGRAHV